MVFLYNALVIALVLVGLLVRRRVAALEKRYLRVAREADQVLRQSSVKDGNSNRYDPYSHAKKQFMLGQIAQKRDRVEARYTSWQLFSEKLGRLTARIRAWKGLKLPYAFGAIDVATVLALIDYLGVGNTIGVRALVDWVRTQFGW